MTREEVITVCEIVGSLLVSDFILHDDEMSYLEELYTRLAVSPSEREQIESNINVLDDVRSLARKLSREAQVELLDELNRAAMADGIVVPQEEKIIKQVEELLAGEGEESDIDDSGEAGDEVEDA